MKEIWVKTNDLIGKYNLPKTAQGIAYKAKTENWKKRKVVGVKGGGYEFEVSSIIDKFNLIQGYDSGNLQPNKTNDKTSEYKEKIRIPAAEFLNNYIMVPELVVIISNGHEPYVTTNDVGEIILSKKFLEKEGLLNTKLATISMIGDSMENTIHDGDTILVSIKDYTLSTVLDGIFVILLKNALIVKRLQYDPVNVTYNVKSDNPTYQDFIINPSEEPSFKVIAKLERILSKK